MKFIHLAFCFLAFIAIHKVTVNALYTFLTNDEAFCLQEDLNPGSFAHISYEATNLGIMESLLYTVTNSENTQVDERVLSEKKAMLYFTSPADRGDVYEICFKPRSILHAPLKFSVKIDTDAPDKNKAASKSKLERLNQELDVLKNRLNAVREDHAYFRQREERFRKTTDSTSSRVFWFALFEIGVLLTVGYYQAINMKHFFKSKKIQ